MNMYHLMRNPHPLAGALLGVLGFTQEAIDDPDNPISEIPRLRDCFLFEDDIRILTRTGGANRKDNIEGNKMLTEAPGYIRDWDDEFDDTYAWWSFKWPDDDPEITELIKRSWQKISGDEKLLEELCPKDVKEILQSALERMVEKL